jgi:hypothetical protein
MDKEKEMNMKKLLTMAAVMVAYILILTGGAGCNGSSSDDGGTITNVVTNVTVTTLSGSWNGAEGGGTAFSMHLTQSGDAITGTITKSGYTENITGNISGDTVTLTYSHASSPPLVIITYYTLTGNANSSRNNMSGNLVRGSLGIDTTDTWSANK